MLVTDDAHAEAHLGALARVTSIVRQGSRFTIHGVGADFVTDVIECLSEHRIRVVDFRTVMPTLEDVFLRLTGHSIRE